MEDKIILVKKWKLIDWIINDGYFFGLKKVVISLSNNIFIGNRDKYNKRNKKFIEYFEFIINY